MKILTFQILFITLSSLICPNIVGQQRTLPLIPYPQEVTISETKFEITKALSLKLYISEVETSKLITQQLNDEISYVFGNKSGTSASSPSVFIGVKGVSKNFDRMISRNGLLNSEKIGQEGYELVVNANRIIIAANTKKGAFYGTQTLRQLLRAGKKSKVLQGMHIVDWPDLEIRAIMDDISRGPVPTKEFMMQQIERFSALKINMLTYYTQDVVKTKSHPAFAPENGAISISEWHELATYAHKYQIDLVGNFQSFGHFDQILKHPEYAHLGESGMLLSPALDESYQLLEDVYSEMIPAFESDYFHINSDETFDLGTGASKEMVDSLGKAVVFANHIKKIHSIISKMNKRIMMWADIPLEHPEILNLLPKDIILITWNYDDLDDYSELIKPLKQAGFTVLASTGVLNSFSIMPDFNTATKNIKGFISEAVKQNIWGVMNTVWDDGGFALFSRDWYGTSFAADQAWNNKSSYTYFYSRFNSAIYGASNNGLTEAIHTLNELAKLKSTEKMNEGILWDQVIPDSAKNVLMNIQDWGEVQRLATKAQNYLSQFDAQMHSKDVVYIQQVIDIYQFLASSRPKLIEASKKYKTAKSLQFVQPANARARLIEAYKLLTDVWSDLSQLKNMNEVLWVQENKVYALDRVLAKYKNQLTVIASAKEALLHTVIDFDNGVALPDASQIRLDIRESHGWYFQGWLMIDPIPNANGFKKPKFDALQSTGGVAHTFPNVTDEFYYNKVKYRWRRVNTPYFAKVDLAEIHKESKDVVGYAFAHIDIKEDREVRALAGSSDGIEVFVNGESVYSNFIKRPFKIDEDELTLPLKKGRNHLMIRVTNEDGDWAFSFRLPDSEMRSYKNRYKIIE